MPMNRYEIRDEYSLADPELYRAADKDDPEALLEGVAMAGLVGVLRQLGDLSEFAAEIFHDLHEEVMATAARGNSLMIRVQQIESDVHSVEKAFLSQTDHSKFFYNAGVDWKANRQVDQNLIAQGNLPRFVMDSYEECRGPPRLFLLDKFDVAGAGACLKRYTDPSFFKVEASATANADVPREKKIKKAKKKGSRVRYGERPECLQLSSHAKLHQLLLEEHVENGVSKPAYRAKLKRRPNRFSFDSISGKSYMEQLVKSPSSDHKMLQEITVYSTLQNSVDDHNESALEHRSVSPARETEGEKGNPPHADKEDAMLNPTMNQSIDALSDIRTYGVPDVISSISDEETAGKGIAIEERSLIGYQSDDIVSEIDNYVDAPSTMLPEMDSDSELRVKSDFTLYTESQPLGSVKSEEHSHSLSLDSQSTGEFSISDEGNNSYKKEMSSFLSSDSARTSAENPQSEKLSADRFPCTDITEFVVVNASSLERAPEHLHVDEVSKSVISNYSFPGKDSTPNNRPNFVQPTSSLCRPNSVPTSPHYGVRAVAREGGLHVDEVSKSVISNYSFPGKDSTPNNRPNFVQPTSSLCRPNSVPTSPHYGVRAVAREGGLRGANSDETISNSDDEEQKRDLILDSPCSSSVSHSKSLGDNSQISSSGGHIMDGEIRWVSRSADIICHSSDRVDALSPFQLEDDYDQKDLNQFENIIGTEEIVSEENPTPRKLKNKVAKLDDNFAIDYYDTARLGDNVASEVSEGDNQYNLYTEYPNVASEPVNSEAHCSNSSNVNQINAETLILSGIEHSVLLEDLDTHDIGITPEEPTPINGTSELGNRNISEVVETDDVTSNDLVPPESSFYVPGNIGDSSETSCTVQNDGVNPDGGIGGQPLTEISSPLSLKLPSQVHMSLHEFDPVTDQSETAEIVSSVPAVSDDTIREDYSSPVVLEKLVEEHVPYFQDLDMGVHENGTTSLSGVIRESEVVEEEKSDLSGSHLESSLVKEVEEREAAILDFDAVVKTEHDDHPKAEVSPTEFSSYLDSEVKHKADMVSAAKVQPPLEQSVLDTEEESVQQSSVENQVSDVDSLHVGCVAEESSLPEGTELPSASIDDELPKSSKILNSEMSSTLPTSQLQLLDHYDDKEFESSASSFSPVNHLSSVSVFPDGRGYGTDASAYPKDSLGFIYPLGDLFLATNQISLDQLQPLPPLPPLQWRTGKLQRASSTPELGKIEIKEPLPQEIFPPATSIEDVSSLPEQMEQSPIQSPQITSKEENLEHGSSSKANSLLEAIDLPQKVEKEHPRIFTPMESEVPSPAEVVGVAEGSQTVKLPAQIVPHFTLKEDTTEHTLPRLEVDPMNQAADPPPKVKASEVSSPTEEVGVDEGSQTVKLPVQIVRHSSLKEDNAEYSLLSLEADPINQAADPPPKVKASEVPSPAEEVGVAEGSQTVKLPVQIVPHFTLKKENAKHCSPTLEADRINQAADPPPKVVKEQQQQQQLHLASQESEVPSPAVADEVSNESRKMILPRTCNPVIGSVAALDKSRLRKVTERVAPQIEKQDERDALLDQIRAKSFNLKPTAISRPSIQAPNTNLRVAAILEKANAIRQAFAGSDEDDEDNWSDS